MVVLLHVMIALASIGVTTYAFISPSESRLRASYLLIALTLISGTYLVWVSPAHLVQSCVTGLVYVGGMMVAIVSTRARLAAG